MHQDALLIACCRGIDELDLARSRDLHLRIAVDIAVGMSGQSDRRFPAFDRGLDSLYQNRSTENGTVERGTDRSVRTLPHLLEIVFFHACGIRCDCRAFDTDFILLDSVGCIDRNLIISLVTVP